MSITWKLEPITTSNAMCVQTGKSAYSVHTEKGYFSLSLSCNLFVLLFHALELDYDDDGNESDYDDDASQNGFCDTWLS